MTDQRLEKARHEALSETNGQSVHKHLTKLFQEESRFRSRWIWELLQNARDAAPKGGVRVWLRRDSKRLILSHNGLPFTPNSVTHLIYHGSTKHHSTDSDPIGQFGTGFLTTHLISKTVTVKGIFEGGNHFSFLLDRRGNSAEDLSRAMDRSWKAFVKSLDTVPGDPESDATTEYAYPIEQGIATVLDDGIRDLIENAPYLLAFNARIRSLEVDHRNGVVTIEKERKRELDSGVTLFAINENRSGAERMARHVAVIENQGTSVAVGLSRGGKRWGVIEPDDTPRIFVAFPLTATRDFCLPVVVNNESFQPREDRDTVFLQKNREGDSNPNMGLLEGACDLAARLAITAATEDWDSAASLAGLGDLREPDWLDSEWLKSVLAERFIEPLRQAESMLIAPGRRCPPSKGLIPVASDAAMCHELWDMVADQRDVASGLPLREEAPLWANNFISWANLLGKSLDEFPECLTLIKLCERVSGCRTLAWLQSQLVESVDAAQWLDRLHALIEKADCDDLFTRLGLIPDQSGQLKKITELRRDPGIDKDLKDIAESLDLKVRAGLADTRVKLKAIADLQPKTEDEVLSTAIDALIEKEDNDPVDAELRSTNVRLFTWLVRHRRLDKLDGFTVMTRATSNTDGSPVSLIRDPTKIDERPLAPVGCWLEPIRAVADLFPKRQILSDAYHDALKDDAAWIEIEQLGYLRLSPLYKTQRRTFFIPDEPLPEVGKERHRTKETVELSSLAFFERDDTGLDAVRRSKTRACALLNFLANYVLEVDGSALEMNEADCECGKRHYYYRSAWLVPMYDRKWVPLGDNKQSSATAEAIAQLFDGRDEELRQLTCGKGRGLLEALKISLADLSLRAVANDEDTRFALIGSLTDIVRAAGSDANRVRIIADEIRESPELLDEITAHRDRRERVRRNRSIGEQVEQLLAEAIRGWGLKVKPTGVGSDCEVYQDHIVDGQEVVFAVEDGRQSFLIEVKATFGDAVRMTIAQAKKATENKGGFALCVVRLDGAVTPESVRNGCRFIIDIGDRIEPVLGEYVRFQNARSKACVRVGGIELFMSGADVSFVVRTEACDGGLAFEDAVAYLSTVLAPGAARRS